MDICFIDGERFAADAVIAATGRVLPYRMFRASTQSLTPTLYPRCLVS